MKAAGRLLLRIGILWALLGNGPLAAQPSPERTTLTGKVTHQATGEPLVRARVSLHRLRENDEAVGYEGGETATDEAGMYRFEGVEEGRYVLAVSAAGCLLAKRTIKVTHLPATEDVALSSLSRISGRILDRAGRPLADTAVYLLVPQAVFPEAAAFPAIRSFQTTTDAEGRYRLPPVAAGGAQCLAIVPQRGYGVSARRAVPGGQEATDVDISLQEGLSLRIRVQEEGSGEPVAGQPVTVDFSLGPDFGESWNLTAYTLVDGVCTFRGLPPGSYHVRLGEPLGGREGPFGEPVVPMGPRVGTSWLLLPGPEVLEKTLTLPRRKGWDLTGRAFGADGTAPLADSPLRFFVLPLPEGGTTPALTDRMPLGPFLTATDSQGKFRLRLADEMKGLVLVHAPGRGYGVTDPVTLCPEEGHDRLDFALKPLGRLEGWVRLATGGPVAGAVLSVVPVKPKRLFPWEAFPFGSTSWNRSMISLRKPLRWSLTVPRRWCSRWKGFRSPVGSPSKPSPKPPRTPRRGVIPTGP